MKSKIDRLAAGEMLSGEEFREILLTREEEKILYLYQTAADVKKQRYGDQVYIRGLIEFTNYCRKDCLYCGLRKSNRKAERYRLNEEEILSCAQEGYRLGFRTFVLQGGEDPWYTKERIEELVRALKARYPDCAVTLSVGEHPEASYRAWREAGADRYLLRHETADPVHYGCLHPPEQRLEDRMRCLRELKALGYQTGCGFMVGSPGQRVEHLIQELFFLREFRPHMVGLGPFIPHRDTPFAGEPAGSLSLTLRLLSLVRLILPEVLLPATTALGTIAGDGREKGILAGANVVMPNLSPVGVRKKYLLYDNKISTGSEAAEGLLELKNRMERIGCQIVSDRGDWKGEQECMM